MKWNREKYAPIRAGVVVAAGIAAALALSACTSPIDEPQGPAGSDGESRLVIANVEPPTASYWDPAASFGLADEQVASLVFDTLALMNDAGELQPNVATEWKRTSDTELSITLRDDVKFHDGTPLTSADVAASYNRLMDGQPLAKSIFLTSGSATADGNTVSIKTDKPFAPLENSLAVVSIIPKAQIDDPESFKTTANGSGPYKFESYDGVDVILSANADYWGGAPQVDEIDIRYIADADARQNALLSGQIDIATRVGPSYVTALGDKEGFSTLSISPPAQVNVLYQHSGPLGDVRVRQALAYAIDRESISTNLMGGINPIGFSALPTSTPYYQAAGNKFAYDPEKARTLLSEAGYDNNLTLTMSTSTLVPNQAEIDQSIVQYLSDVGITVELTKLEVGEFRTTYTQYDLSTNTLGSFNNDPSFYLSFFAGGTGAAVFGLEDPEIDALVAASNQADETSRQAAVAAASDYLWNNQATLFLTDEVWTTIVSDRVQGYTRAPLMGERLLANVTLTED